MDYHFTEISCREFVQELGSKAPVPGGGGASAMAAAIGASLGSMVANLTIPNPRYAEAAEELTGILTELNELTGEMLACVEEDAVGFEPLSRAYGLPKNTEEEKETRAAVMEDALRTACAAPVRMVEICARMIGCLKILSEKGAKLVLSDAGVGVVLVKAAMQGAVLNVYVNTRMMKNRGEAERLNRHCSELIDRAVPEADAVYASVCERIR